MDNNEADTFQIPIEHNYTPDEKHELSTGLAGVRRAKPCPDTPEMKEGGEFRRTRQNQLRNETFATSINLKRESWDSMCNIEADDESSDRDNDADKNDDHSMSFKTDQEPIQEE